MTSPTTANPNLAMAGGWIRPGSEANLADHHYVWSWDSEVIDSATGKKRGSLRQSIFLSQVISADDAKAGSSQRVPAHSPKMQIDADCLAMAGSGLNFGSIAKVMMERYPQQLPDYRFALDHVVSLLPRYRDN
ncbi:MAG: hypothetical protein U0995_05640 [Erythrobacter sp.]|nr:hypothetical protein [Erythrobacter sp.]